MTCVEKENYLIASVFLKHFDICKDKKKVMMIKKIRFMVTKLIDGDEIICIDGSGLAVGEQTK
jgi:hypothetical protein